MMRNLPPPRAYRSLALEVKSLTSEGLFHGYASTYEVDRHKDQIMPGAFARSLSGWRKQGAWPFLLWYHRADQPLGHWCTMREDRRGLFVQGQLMLNLARAQEVYTLMHKGVVRGLSIGFEPMVFRLCERIGVRKIYQVHLVEVSVVTMPANTSAQIHHVC